MTVLQTKTDPILSLDFKQETHSSLYKKLASKYAYASVDSIEELTKNILNASGGFSRKLAMENFLYGSRGGK